MIGIQTDSWCHPLFLKHLVQSLVHDRRFFAHKRNDKKHRIKILYQVLPKAR